MKNKNGFITILVMIWIFVLSIGLMTLTHIYIQYTREIESQYGILKSRYLAQSGLSVAKVNWNSISIQNIPQNDEKKWIYEHLNLAHHPNLELDGDIYLMKTASTFYSISKTKQGYRCIIKTSYLYENNTIIFSNQEVL